MGKSTNYYKTHPEARKKKAETDKKINSRPDQLAKRRELAKKNYEHDKAHGEGSRKGKDLSHVGKKTVYKLVKSNRGSKSDSKGDKNARGGKK